MKPTLRWAPCITPSGSIKVVEVLSEAAATEGEAVPPALRESFAQSTAAGLTYLASSQGRTITSSAFLFWRQFAERYFRALCRQYAQASRSWTSPQPPDEPTLQQTLDAAPPMQGLEYASTAVLTSMWHDLDRHTCQQVGAREHDLAGYLAELEPQWNLVGRVTFHLAENKKNAERPFAFLATYTEGQSKAGSPQHTPLAAALRHSIETKDNQRLDQLLEPVARAAKRSPLVLRLIDSRALFAPQAWSIAEAFDFLSQVPQMEDAGIIVRVPNWWNASRPPRPQVAVHIGTQRTGPTLAGALDFHVDVSIDGDPLTPDELAQLLAVRDGMTLLRGQWVQVDPQQLKSALQHWRKLQRKHLGGLDFIEGMRLLAGAPVDQESVDDQILAWTRIESGPWLAQILAQLRDPKGAVKLDPGRRLRATLRPYQAQGVQWLWLAVQLGLGVCLADDMGLGKTIQVIALLLQLKYPQHDGAAADRAVTASTSRKSRRPSSPDEAAAAPSLLIVPTSLLGNWQRELARFAPDLRVFTAHRSAVDADTLQRLADQPARQLADYDLVMTTYGLARTAKWLSEITWRLVILDEAQAIKNASAAQTRAIKQLSSHGRLMLTGTPVENHLGDLWSLFDFASPGLLGTAAQLQKLVNSQDDRARARGLATIRRLIRPYVLRRLKTDPQVAPDLPDKTEMRIDCGLTPIQAALYQQILKELSEALRTTIGIQRRGLVLATLMQLKQVCNHPSLYLKQSEFADDASGKYTELRAIAEILREKQEKMLVFTQFQSMCDPLHEFLQPLFGTTGLVLTGQTAAAKRSKLVAEFQQESGPPFFVISLKAGGTGLNLTQACHVVHFDRWWNPAVEDQATDRAFRIGQNRNVLVHKFVCRGTLEERIDELITAKKDLSHELFGEGDELNLTEMSNEQLIEFVSLDLNKATAR